MKCGTEGFFYDGDHFLIFNVPAEKKSASVHSKTVHFSSKHNSYIFPKKSFFTFTLNDNKVTTILLAKVSGSFHRH